MSSWFFPVLGARNLCQLSSSCVTPCICSWHTLIFSKSLREHISSDSLYFSGSENPFEPAAVTVVRVQVLIGNYALADKRAVRTLVGPEHEPDSRHRVLNCSEDFRQ